MYPRYLKIIGALLHVLSWLAPKLSSRIALRIFATPGRRTLSARQINFLEAAQVFSFICNNRKEHYYHWAGKGKKVLLLHGWKSNAGRWAPLQSELASAGYDVYALDAPAHGRSGSKTFTAPDYAALINELMQKEAIEMVVAHSVGGMAILYYLYKYGTPVNLKKLVLLAPSNHFSVILENYAQIIGMSKRSYRLLEAYIIEKYDIRVGDFRSSLFAKDLRVPSLLIHDRKDKVLDYEGSIELSKVLFQNEFVTTEGLGHRLISNEVYHEIMEYLAKPS